jgi:exopolyphosphatase/guanosine-5'-triphosphate,3'-diphosphate pyrophosphatase
VNPGELSIHIADRAVEIVTGDGRRFVLPVGPLALHEGPLERADPPAPEMLTNALGLVHDHLDDVIIEAPAVATADEVVATGPHALAMARVEIGADDVPVGYVLSRADADEVFRTLAVEPVVDRRHNPGLEETHVESIIGTCCVILGVMRRLDLTSIAVVGGQGGR